ncbi:hypothetical protein FHL15_010415 [Xylaria flabelliformis]|uniref:Uncharacterized protein n=1 Tax=Xylaria flabelliformis TaxID=2512241 RepID=A0A553HL20_9PEZI|nr:hypothetical protein FHL15_010415 [Xylaria flabelliformis]
MADTTQRNEVEQKQQTRLEWAREKYNEQYDAWMPWIEDVFLKYFTKDNRTSYVARDGLDKTKVTGVTEVDALQDKTNDLAASQLGQGGLLQPVGDLGSSAMKAVDPRGKKTEKDDKNKDNNNNKGSGIPVVSSLGF